MRLDLVHTLEYSDEMDKESPLFPWGSKESRINDFCTFPPKKIFLCNIIFLT